MRNKYVQMRINYIITMKGFEGIGLTEEKKEELFNEKCGLNLSKEEIKHCTEWRDIFDLPISIMDKAQLDNEIYKIGSNYVDTSETAQFRDLFKSTVTTMMNKYSDKGKELILQGICPKCKSKVNPKDNFCGECGFKLYVFTKRWEIK